MSQHIYKTLHKTSKGFIAKCSGCTEIQIMFGNYFSWMPEERFHSFLEGLNQLDTNNENLWVEIGNESRIMIKTPCANVMTAFSKAEFDEFMELMHISALILQTEYLINN